MTAPTLFDRWTPEQEAHRHGCVVAGVEPRLHRWWASTPTSVLAASLTEYRSLPDELDLRGVICDLENEIAYRTEAQR